MRGRGGRELKVMLNGSMEGCLEALQKAGYDTIVPEEGLPDPEVQRQANREGRTTVTGDTDWKHEDLEELREHGAVWVQAKERSVKGDSIAEKAKLALHAMKKCKGDLLENKLIRVKRDPRGKIVTSIIPTKKEREAERKAQGKPGKGDNSPW